MTLSFYVVDALSELTQYEPDQQYRASAHLKEKGADAENQQDAYILRLISGVLSMSYIDAEKSFAPMIALADGNRSFSAEDLVDGDIEILECILEIVKPTWIRAHISHLLWLLKKAYKYGELAVTTYLEIFQSEFDPDQWVSCESAIQRALEIAVSLGKTTPSFTNVQQTINNSLDELNGTDPLFLSLRMITSISKYAAKEDKERYLHLANRIFSRHISENTLNWNLVDEAFDVYTSLLRSIKKELEIKQAKRDVAGYYELQATTLIEKGDILRASELLKKTCHFLHGVDQERLLNVREQLESLQRENMKNLGSYQYEIDLRPIHDAINPFFENLSLQETIVQLGRMTRRYSAEKAKEEVIGRQKQFIFSSLFGTGILNDAGQVVANLPPLSHEDPASDELLLFKHMVRYVAEQQQLEGSTALRIAFGHLQHFGPVSAEDLNFLICDNAIIPEGREDIIKEGLALGLSGKLYTAMHILLPQTENIIRYLVRLCGDTITFLKEDGSEEFKPLSQLLASEKLKESYDESFIFTFKSLLTEPIGANLRNLNAHGLLDSIAGNSTISLYFLCLLIKFLSMYGKNVIPVLRALTKKDENMSQKPDMELS